MSDPQIDSRLKLAIEIAREAGRQTLAYFQKGVEAERKGDQSPVTVADREAEQFLRGEISAAFPDDAILGEEFPAKPGTSGYRWIVDPIDGTKSFISGVPLYGTMVAVEHEGKAVVGVVEMPALDERIYAARGSGAWHSRGDEQPVAARVSTAKSLSEGTFVTTQVSTFADRALANDDKSLDAFFRLEKAAYITRTWGDCYGYLLVATGRALATVDPIMNVWDAAAVQPIMEEAGGTFTDWKGEPTIHSGEAIGTNGHVLEEILAVTRDYPKPA